MVKILKNLPPPPPKISWRAKTLPKCFSDQRLQDLIRKLTELEQKIDNFYKEQNTSLVSQIEKIWDSILVPGSVILIIGKRGSGKSTLGFLVLEKLSYKMECYVVNLPRSAYSLLPANIGVIQGVENAPFGSALLIDEAAIEFPARMSGSGKNKKLLEVISLARQRNQIIIFISQETGYLDINILRGLSTLITKEPSPLQGKFERYQIKEFIDKARLAFDRITGDKRNWAYVAFSSGGYEGLIRTPKPTFFSDKLSSCYASFSRETIEKEAKILSKAEKKEKAYTLYVKDKLSVRQIARRLGVSKSTAHNWIKEMQRKKRQSKSTLSRLLSQLGQMGEN
jgi:DNA-binding transcriptional regulator YiaG